MTIHDAILWSFVPPTALAGIAFALWTLYTTRRPPPGPGGCR